MALVSVLPCLVLISSRLLGDSLATVTATPWKSYGLLSFLDEVFVRHLIVFSAINISGVIGTPIFH